jgi:CelD/BcsL family acetyltransferase involved in cellulose biosynthesis
MEEAGDGALTGLLTLALRRNGSKLTGAGEQQAEYQGWIQAADADNGFIVNAIREIRARFPDADLYLKYLPPGIPLHWVGEKGNYGELCSLRSHARPVMRIDAAAMDRQRNKKNHRQNYNRLKRLGEVGFQRVVEHEYFLRIFDEICNQYDFRQAALYRSMPFATDPAKKPFYLELHKKGLLHVTILTVGKVIAASHIGLLSEERAVHLGINTYDPALAAHSPGNLLLAMLGVHLAAEKMPVLDLTPGGDGYKEHFATEHDAVFELTIYSDRKRRLRTEALLSVIRYSKKRLQVAGYRPTDVLAAIEKVKGFRPSGLRDLLGKLRLRSNARQGEFRYRRSPGPVMTDKLPISKNRLDDVLKFDAHGSSAEFRAFSDTVMKRMERSNDLYCFVHDDQLRMSCWARTGAAGQAVQQSTPDPAASGDSIVLFDLCVHRRQEDKELVRRFVEQILHELNEQKSGADVLYRGALDKELQAVVERCGFVDEAK